MGNNKSIYIDFCDRETNIPIFSTPWWLDAVCGPENWDVILVEKGNEIVASFPYYMKKGKLGMKYITMPILTQKLGSYIKYPANQKYSSRLSYEKEIMLEIINQLPPSDYFNVHFDYRYSNWLPFYWKDFQQTTRYTYVLEDISDPEHVFSCFEHSKRKNIKKAIKEVEIFYDLPCEDFYENHKMTLQKQGEVISYSYEIFERIYKGIYANNAGRVIYCKDSEGNIHAALLVIWDNESAFDLISTIDPSYRNSGAATLLVYEMIKLLSGKVNKFDFEGSMIEGVEESFRKFGTIQKSYFRIYKQNSRKCKLIHAVKDFVHAFRN
ncbi:MAG: GNAT family N-acetyltransferase [Butyricimonas virosa]|jgi:hypothetical protein|uniref:GNAT family N-acetyltransferase n=1 Tax=Butyricimonas virosa TaxID=544645 RepID=UPI00242F9CD8|nr:GNAT family N-acetyltransferase [Butyricimonas virosa]MCI6413336.1 GNAT family N-acetyltransferase [Butyricimonas virosa]